MCSIMLHNINPGQNKVVSAYFIKEKGKDKFLWSRFY